MKDLRWFVGLGFMFIGAVIAILAAAVFGVGVWLNPDEQEE